jgi:hypothetical protein
LIFSFGIAGVVSIIATKFLIQIWEFLLWLFIALIAQKIDMKSANPQLGLYNLFLASTTLPLAFPSQEVNNLHP